MKALILYATAGGGHKSAALTIERYLQAKVPGCTAKAADAMAATGRFANFVCCRGYHFLATKMPAFFGFLYRATNRPSQLERLMNFLTAILSWKLLVLIEEEQPDIIISAYPFATGMISLLKKNGRLSTPLLCVMTDYGPHRAWLGDHVDSYVVATEEMIAEMEKMGTDPKCIHPLGIPVREEFFAQEDHASLLREMELSPDLPTLLIMAGSFGVSSIIGIYRKLITLPREFQAIVITGNNEKLYRAFEYEITQSPRPTKLVKFTSEVDRYMHASDLIITKPGGLTTSEALAAGLPLCVFDAIPGQEEDNADFLIQHGMAVKLEKNDCVETVGGLLQDPERLLKMQCSCREHDRSHVLSGIAELAMQLVTGKSN